jgi:hypothetical protein
MIGATIPSIRSRLYFFDGFQLSTASVSIDAFPDTRGAGRSTPRDRSRLLLVSKLRRPQFGHLYAHGSAAAVFCCALALLHQRLDGGPYERLHPLPAIGRGASAGENRCSYGKSTLTPRR